MRISFCKQYFELPINKDSRGLGWVLKTSHTTHNFGRKFCRNIYAIERRFRMLCGQDAFIGHKEFFLEPRYANRKEIKTVIPENDVTCTTMNSFFAKSHVILKTDQQAYARHQDVKAFAQKVKAELKKACVDVACSPLLRVDTFESQCGMLRVNEVESLDALVEASGQLDINRKRAPPDTDILVAAFKVSFLEDKLTQLVQMALNE